MVRNCWSLIENCWKICVRLDESWFGLSFEGQFIDQKAIGSLIKRGKKKRRIRKENGGKVY